MLARVFFLSISIALRSISATFLLIGAAFAVEPVTADPVDFQITGQPLDSALNEFARQSDREIFYASDVVDGVYVNGVDGKYEPEDALELLLADSGLEYSVTTSDTFLVSDHGGDSDSKNLSPAPILMAQNTSSPAQTRTEITNRSDEGGTSVITGRVTDARTGTNLRGAKVTIEETGQWTSTSELGRFRFVNVPTGSVTLSVSFLGYAGQSAVVNVRNGGAAQDFALRGGSEIEEIVVFGTRSARAQSLNQERVAPNSSTVLASDFLGQFDGKTVSEVLRRAPGVAFEQDPATGDGTNIIVRGLEPDFNTVTLNGLRLPEGSGRGRSPELNNILTDSISEIVISKTLLPSQDGTGTGGLVDIKTKGPLDRDRRFFSIGVEGSFRGSDFEDDFLASATSSATFGSDDRLGLSASVQYREQQQRILNYDASLIFGDYLPLDSEGEPIRLELDLDPRAFAFPYESGAVGVRPQSVSTSGNTADTDTLSITLTGEYLLADHTKLRADYFFSESQDITNVRGVNFGAVSRSELVPIDSLGGEERYSRVWRDARLDGTGPGAFTRFSRFYRGDDETNSTESFSLSGETSISNLDFNYKVGFAIGESSGLGYNISPNTPLIRITDLDSFLSDTARGQTRGDFYLPPFSVREGDDVPVPLLTEAGFSLLNNDPAYAGVRDYEVGKNEGSNERQTFGFDVKYSLDSSVLSYIKVGVFFEKSRFENFSFTALDADLSGIDSALLGLTETTDNILSDIGVPGVLLVVPESNISDFRSQFSELETSLNIPVTRANSDSVIGRDTFTEEENLAFFLEGQIDIGKLELVGGVRFESVDVSTASPLSVSIFDVNGVPQTEEVEQLGETIRGSGSQSTLLPRVAATYRFTDNLLARFGYYKTVARPRNEFISDVESFQLILLPFFGENQDQPFLSFRKSNPDIEPAEIENFDANIEYYFSNGGVLKTSAFYKKLSNLLDSVSQQGLETLDGITLPDSPSFNSLPENIFISASQAQNSEFDAEIWGLELVVEKQLTFLPDLWSGLGVMANYTYTDSERTFLRSFGSGSDLMNVPIVAPFSGDPQQSGTVGLTYSMYGIDASLGYTAQDRRQLVYDDFDLSLYNEADDSLDLRIEYRFEVNGKLVRTYFEGSDLLKGTGDPDVMTSFGGDGRAPIIIEGGNYLGGRVFTFGIAANF